MEALLRFAPRTFKERHAVEFLTVHTERSARVQGVTGRIMFALRELIGTTALVVRLHMGARFDRNSGMERGGGTGMGSWMKDLRMAGRNLVRRPGFTLGVALTLGLGIGATTTIYSVVDGVMLRPLSYDDPSALVALGAILPTADPVDTETGLYNLAPMSVQNYRNFRERTRSFENMAAFEPARFLVGELGSEEYVDAARVPHELFEILGASLALGRMLGGDDYRLGDDGVALITYGYWQRRYGGDPSVLGQPLEPAGSGARSTIVGILSRDFRPPEAFFPGDEVPEIYAPMPESEAGIKSIRRWSLGTLHVLGRLHRGTSVEQARVEADNIAADLAAEFPNQNITPDGHQLGIGLNDLHAQTVGATGRTLWIFLGAAGLLLLLTAMNAATLLLSRALDRRQELGVRMALGASRSRLVRLFMVEAGLLSMLGGALGVLLAYGGAGAFLRYAPSSIPRLSTVAVDGRVLAVAAAVSLGTGMMAGLLPALRLTRRAPWERLRSGGHSVAESASGLRTALIGGQLGLAVILLSGAGLLFGSFMRIRAADPGFEPEGLITMTTASMGGARRMRIGEAWRLWDPVLVNLGAAPGVTSVAGASDFPFQSPTWAPRLLLRDDGPETVREGIAGYAVTPGYLETMGITLLQGRGIERLDGPDAEHVALVNRSFVRTQLEGRDPMNMVVQRVTEVLGGADQIIPMRVVGVVADVVQARAEEGPRPAIYIPYTQADLAQILSWGPVVRTEQPMDVIVPELRRALAEDNLLPQDLITMPDRMAATHTTTGFQTMLIGAFALVAMLLAAAGLYGSLAHTVRRRQRELGIRMALGADRAAVLRMVLTQGMRVSMTGLAFGMIATLGLSRVLSGFLYDMEPYDPATLLMVGAVLALVSAVACLAPARRATAVDPVAVLKAE